MQKNKNFRAGLTAIVAALSLALGTGTAFAAVLVSTPATASVSSDSLSGSSAALPALTLTEGAAGDIQIGTLAWALPSGFVFDTTSVANVTATGTGLTTGPAVGFPDSNHFSINVTATSTTAGSITIGSTTPLKVKVTSGTPLAASGNITLSSGSINGLSGSASFGLLSQTPGAANKLSFTLQPPSTAANNAAFSASVSVQDQFGNTVTGDNGRSITLSSVLNSNTASSSTAALGGTTATNDTNGTAAFNNLSYSLAESIRLMAASSPLTSTLSNAIAITATAPPPTSTPTNLANGTLVKFAGDPTIYMVVNGTLRPFNSAAIFHARGKKFEDVEELDGEERGQFTLGKEVGKSEDDNIPSPTAASGTPISLASTTPPSLAGLPDGTIVKAPGNPTVYIITGGVLQPFTSLSVFKAHKKSFSEIQTISSTTLASLPIGAPAEFPDGTLLKGSDKTVYVVKGGQLFAIPSVSVFTEHGWSFSNVLNLEDNELARHGKGGLED